MEYEEGTPFCNNCGGNLVTKKEPKPTQEDKKKQGEARPDGRLVCPKCHILYEKLTTCIRCGAPLITQAALKQMEEAPPSPVPETNKVELKAAPPPEVEKEPLSIPPPRKRLVEPRRGEIKRPEPVDLEQEPALMEAAQKGPQKKLEDKRERPFKLEKPKKPFFRSLHGILSIILLLMVATYLLITQVLTTQPVGPVPSTPKKLTELSDKEGSTISEEASPTLPSSSLPVVQLPQEIQKLLDLLENVRQANLRKNINLLMSCYSSDYKDLDERRRTALQAWSKYNYLDLEYVLKVESVSIDSAKARVEWRTRSIPIKGGQTEEGRSVLNVTFQKERNEWKIQEVTPAR
ncbi:MAG: hypothetical protein ACUVWO_12985 [Thermodesulfobacteriota bacterium]